MVEAVFIYSANELASHIPPRKEKSKKKKPPKKVLIVKFRLFLVRAGTPQSPSVRAEYRR